MFKIQKIHRWTPFLLVLLILASVLMPVLATKIAYADGQEGSFISDKVSGKVLDHQLYFFLKRCFIDINMDKVPSDEIDDWSWWKGSGDMGYRGDMYQNNYVKCSEGEWIEEAFSRFGFTDPLDTFCRLGFTYNRVTGGLGKTVDGGNTVEACKAGYDKGDFDGSMKIIVVITNFMAGISGVIIVAALVWGGIMYSMAGNDPSKVQAAKKRIYSALTALLLLVFGYAIIQWLVPGGLF